MRGSTLSPHPKIIRDEKLLGFNLNHHPCYENQINVCLMLSLMPLSMNVLLSIRVDLVPNNLYKSVSIKVIKLS